MAMKKKFLGLALATAVAIPAILPNAVYATGTADATQDKQTITSENNNVNVDVIGEVATKTGQRPEKIEVVLPSKLGFTVNEGGVFSGADCKIENNSTNVDIDIAVDSFTGGRTLQNGSGEGIQVLTKTEFNKKVGNNSDDSQLYRNQIRLSLSKIDGTELDLANCKNIPSSERKIGTLKSGQKTTLRLDGAAGMKAVDQSNQTAKTDVDTKGAREEFKLIFSISKTSDQAI